MSGEQNTRLTQYLGMRTPSHSSIIMRCGPSLRTVRMISITQVSGRSTTGPGNQKSCTTASPPSALILRQTHCLPRALTLAIWPLDAVDSRGASWKKLVMTTTQTRRTTMTTTQTRRTTMTTMAMNTMKLER